MTAFATVKNRMVRGKLLRLLAAVIAGGPTGIFMAEADAKKLNEADPTLTELALTTKDAAGNVAIRATSAGVLAGSEAQAAATAPAEPAAEFTIEQGYTVPPPSTRGGAKSSKYPFEKMAVGDSFFVAATEARPTPAKSLASTVASATKRFKDQTPARKFVARAVKETRNGVVVDGARVWRTA